MSRAEQWLAFLVTAALAVFVILYGDNLLGRSPQTPTPAPSPSPTPDATATTEVARIGREPSDTTDTIPTRDRSGEETPTPLATQTSATTEQTSTATEPVEKVTAARAEPVARPVAMNVGPNPAGLAITVSRPVVQAQKWTIVRVDLTLTSDRAIRVSLPKEEYYRMSGWSARVGGGDASCESNDDRIDGLDGRSTSAPLGPGEELPVTVEFTCGHGDAYQPGGSVRINVLLLVDTGSGPVPVRASVTDLPYTPPR